MSDMVGKDWKARSKRRGARRGGIYVVVLGVAMIVGIVSMSAMQMSRLQMKNIVASENIGIAQMLAQSAVEYAMAVIDADPLWRTTYTHGVENPTSWVSMPGQGEFKFMLLDSDGDLADNADDAVTVKGIGKSNDAIHVANVLLQPLGDPLDCLGVSLCAGGDLTAGWTVNVISDQIIASNGNVSATNTNSSVEGEIQAAGTITGNIIGTQIPGAVVRELPQEDVFQYYLFNGTWIDVNTLPVDGFSRPLISATLLSPQVNPFGAKNPAGIYVIDCQGQNLCIKNSRIVGTLVLLNPGPSAGLNSSMSMEPAVANFPSLLVEGTVCIKTSKVDLNESTLLVNFNPVGTPYEAVEDADQSDVYPSIITGLVYVSGTMAFPGDLLDSCFRGVVVCEQIAADSDFFLEYDSTTFNQPPPGFMKGPTMRIVPASWQRASY